MPDLTRRTLLAGAAATEALGEEWRREGCAAIGRRVRRFFALHGLCDG